MPKLSIITVNLNNGIGLDITIRSVIDQSFTDYEFIIIDGASTDNSLEILKFYENRISFWKSEPDKGIYYAMNKGIVKANGTYCLFLNSGDILADNNILKNLIAFDLSEDIILCRSIPYSNGNPREVFENRISSSEITFNDLFITSFNHQATLIRRELFSKYGLYNEKYKVISDHLFIIKVLGMNNCSFRFIDFVITSFNADGISQNVQDYYQSEIIPAYRAIIPDRIFKDYDTGYLTIIKKLKNHPVYWLFFRLLCRIVRLYKS